MEREQNNTDSEGLAEVWRSNGLRNGGGSGSPTPRPARDRPTFNGGHRRSDVRFGAHRRLKSDMTRGPIKCRYRKRQERAHQLENGPPKGERQKGRRSRARA